MAGTAVVQMSQQAAIAVGCPKQRSMKRKLLRLPAWIVFYRTSLKKHVTMVRDMTREGIFFYSDVRPSVGEEIAFVLKFPKWTKTPTVACKGEVMRVEEAVPGAHPGVAVRLSHFVVWN